MRAEAVRRMPDGKEFRFRAARGVFRLRRRGVWKKQDGPLRAGRPPLGENV